jgi:hypothetical protein
MGCRRGAGGDMEADFSHPVSGSIVHRIIGCRNSVG